MNRSIAGRRSWPRLRGRLFECWLTADELTKLTVELIELLDTSDIVHYTVLNRSSDIWQFGNCISAHSNEIFIIN